MKKNKKYLSIEEKKELIRQGITPPICISDNPEKDNSFIVKIRNIFDGSLKNKRMRL